ncbi:MAG: aminoacyl-tRNA hydrolase [Candidatus Zixiibacteriota bacterium]|nr:MAG: aminoacyl-tRNA hydrolase [candidate division Zixibacteria bacterium]
MLSLVLGLGNIGERYAKSRHNLGFRVIERLLADHHLPGHLETAEYSWAVTQSGSVKVIFATPKTYMNRSGDAARALLQQNNLEPSGMLVVVDDYYLPLGRIRIRRCGSDGGHNGLASIIETLETDLFPRMRLGIGPVPEEIDSAAFVLRDFDEGELDTVEKMIATASEAVMFTVEHGLEEAMSKYNRNPAWLEPDIPGQAV